MTALIRERDIILISKHDKVTFTLAGARTRETRAHTPECIDSGFRGFSDYNDNN